MDVLGPTPDVFRYRTDVFRPIAQANVRSTSLVRAGVATRLGRSRLRVPVGPGRHNLKGRKHMTQNRIAMTFQPDRLERIDGSLAALEADLDLPSS